MNGVAQLQQVSRFVRKLTFHLDACFSRANVDVVVSKIKNYKEDLGYVVTWLPGSR